MRDYNDGLDNSEQQGMKKQAVEDAKNFYANDVSIEIITKSLNITLEEVQEIMKDIVPMNA